MENLIIIIVAVVIWWGIIKLVKKAHESDVKHGRTMKQQAEKEKEYANKYKMINATCSCCGKPIEKYDSVCSNCGTPTPPSYSAAKGKYSYSWLYILAGIASFVICFFSLGGLIPLAVVIIAGIIRWRHDDKEKEFKESIDRQAAYKASQQSNNANVNYSNNANTIPYQSAPMSRVICPNCGNDNGNNTRFCVRCGTRF
jgi:hypothetical protein